MHMPHNVKNKKVIGGYVFKFAGAQYLVRGGLGAMLACLFALMWREHSADEPKSRKKEI